MNMEADSGNLKARPLGLAGPDKLRIEVRIILVLFARGFRRSDRVCFGRHQADHDPTHILRQSPVSLKQRLARAETLPEIAGVLPTNHQQTDESGQ